jgi:1,2-diacylglycerol 3-beta-glucosyltransferase
LRYNGAEIATVKDFSPPMPENPLSEDEYIPNIDDSTFDNEGEEFRSDFFQGLSGRRQKAAFVLILVWTVTIALHSVSWGYYLVLAVAGLIFVQVVQLFTATPEELPEALTDIDLAADPNTLPKVSLLVAAKNEEAVVTDLVRMLCAIDYPIERTEIWIVDDASGDRTPEILDRLAQSHPQLQVLHRLAGSTGGKSGALNQVFSLCKGDIVGVFDADAKIKSDLLRSIVPLFDDPTMGAVQVRKSIANSHTNFLTRGQATEMALDSYLQQQRIATGGIGELRGNGQFVSREALNSCGGWNEQTITDDLDLTLRLHLDNWKIGFLAQPAVAEEGVTTIESLWHQRNRWAEGGFQRYLDYWRFLLGDSLNWTKKTDLFLFFILLQYLLPSAAIPDFLMAWLYHRYPLYIPLTVLTLSLTVLGSFLGLIRIHRQTEKISFGLLLKFAWQSLIDLVYMCHWLAIMPCITLRMSLRPKRLKWVKTVHRGSEVLGT